MDENLKPPRRKKTGPSTTSTDQPKLGSTTPEPSESATEGKRDAKERRSIPASALPEDPNVYLPFGGHQEGTKSPGPPVLPPPTQESLIPIHQFVRLFPREVAVVNHPAFQRLGTVFQLGQTFLVFRGATHCRFEHSLGTLHVAQLIIDSLDRADAGQGLLPTAPSEWALDEPLTAAERRLIRLGALIHDIGHLPAGHTLEDELGILDHHDAVKRLELILDRSEWCDLEPEETLRQLIDRLYADAAAETQSGLTATELVLSLVARDMKSKRFPTRTKFRVNVGQDIIGNTICADLVDYIYRDWEHLGKGRHFDHRLIDYMELRKTGGRSELVINLRTSNDVRSDAVSAILELLESRYQLGEIALFHKTKLCAAAMLERLVAELDDCNARDGRTEWRDVLPDRLLECSDWEFLALLKDDAFSLQTSDKEFVSNRVDHLVRMAGNLRTRRLHKKLIQMASYELAGGSRRVQDLYADGGPDGTDTAEKRHEKLRQAAENRLRAVRTLEKDFGLPPLSVVMYCPPPRMNTKVAEVKVLFNGRAHTLDQHEAEDPDNLTGGHLTAQKDRFKRLWRVQFAVERSALAFLRRTDQLELFMNTVEKLVLGRVTQGSTLESTARSLANLASGREASPLHGKELVEVGFNRGSFQDVGYPTGAPALIQHLADQ